MAFCPQCGCELMDGDRFCNNCGAPVRERQNMIVNRNVENYQPVVYEQNGATSVKKGLAVILMAASLIYSFVMPVDLVPDVIPLLGWVDDLGMMLIATLNMIQQFIKDQDSIAVNILNILKWILIVLVIIVVALLGGLVAFIVSLFKH